MRTIQPEVIKNCFLQFQTGACSVSEIAEQNHIAYNTAKHLGDIFHDKHLEKTDLSKLSYSQASHICYEPRKTDNNGYYPIDFEEMFCLIDKHHYDRGNAHYVYLRQAKKEYNITGKLKTYSYAQFCKKLRQARPIVPSHVLHHEPGHSVQVDFAGSKGNVTWTDKNDVDHTLEMFVACLPKSGLIFCYPVQNQQIDNWLLCNEKLFEFIGGVTVAIVSDNLLCGAPHKRFYVEPFIMWSRLFLLPFYSIFTMRYSIHYFT